jgi:MoaA/NifB/PqqE/SkfB family radical SAM enzyme
MLTNKKNNSHFIERDKKYFVENKSLIAEVPKNVLVELTNACNHACVFCYNPRMKRSISHLDIHIYEQFIKKCSDEGVEEVGLYSTGDPFMTKNLDAYISIAKRLNIKRVYITTNGALANFEKAKKCIDAGLDSIKFSINAGSNETYKIIHGFDDFEKVKKNVIDIYRYIKSKKLKVDLFSSFVYTSITFKEIDNFKKEFSKYFKEMIFWEASNQGGRNIELSKEITKNIKKDAPKTLTAPQPCEMLWNRIHFTAEGYLTACCVDYENDLTFSQFDNKNKLFNQFNSEPVQKLREKHLKNDLDNTICKGCIYNKNYEYDKILKKTEKPLRNLNEKKKLDLEKRISVLKNAR